MSRSHLIAVASGKGGVGKTWLCIALAHALAKAGRRVLLFDADFGMANVDIQLGLMPEHDLSSVLAGKVGLWDAIVTHAEGFDILPGRSGSGTLTGLSPAIVGRVLALARTAAAEYDVTLVDLGTGLEPPVRRMAAEADELLIITTDEPTSLTDAYAVLKLNAKDSPKGPARIVANQALSHSAGERTYATIRRAAATFLSLDPPLAGVIRRDSSVSESIRAQGLLLMRRPTCPAANDIERLSRLLGPSQISIFH